MKLALFLLFTGGVTLLFVTPAQAFEELGDVHLEPMSEPSTPADGTEFRWLRDGVPYSTHYEQAAGDIQRNRDSNGCTWSRAVNVFSPPTKWYDCYQERHITMEVSLREGEPWPLQSDTEFEFEFNGSYDDGFGPKWHGIRACRVIGSIRIKVPAGEFDTWKLLCEDEWDAHTYWIAPELGSFAAHKHRFKSLVSRSYFLELVEIVRP